MAKISNETVYIVDTGISDIDSLIGTDGNTSKRRTKNFLLGQLKTYFKSGLSPLTGGVLRFTEISYTGGLYANVAALVNALDPVFIIEQYHVVVVNLNGAKSILKLQNRSVGIDLPLVLTTDFITLPTSAGATGKGISSVTKTSTSGLADTYTITFTDATTTNFTLTNGAAGANSTVPGSTGNGVTSIVKTSTAGLVDTYTVTFTNGATTTFTITNGTNGVDASNNLQRDVTVSFTLADTDNNYVIQLKNTSAIIITIPASGLRTKFNVGFSRLGVGEVSFVGASGVTLQNPTGYRINRQFDPCYIERDVATQVYTLYGNTKV